MEKIELVKKLEKKKASFACLMLFLALVSPTLLGLCRELKLSGSFQLSIMSGILMLIGLSYKKMSQLRVQIKTLVR